jgi:predicted nucleic acid-binding protein
VKKFVWDTSAILNLKEPNGSGYSPAHSLWKDLADGWICGPYLNLFPAIALFEVSASVSRKLREGSRMLREFYLLDDASRVYVIDEELVRRSYPLFTEAGFDRLRGADLVFACIAKLEGATLVTLDAGFQQHVGGVVDVLDLNDSRDEARYRERFRG